MAGENKPTLVALRARREHIIEKLSEHFAGDALDMEEFEQRLDLAHRATSIAELDQLVADLESEPVAAAEPEPEPEPEAQPEPERALAVSVPEKKRMLAIMGGATRKGRWRVPRKLRIVTIMGGADLDFREAEFGPGVHEVKITTIMGGTDIIVPPTLAVECEGAGIMGGFDHVDRAPVERDPDDPVLIIKGIAIMGGVDIKTRLPGEGSIRAWFRERRERKQLAEAQQKKLAAARRKQLPEGKK